MNRIKYENYLGAAGYDAVARRKIKELEKKLGPQMVEKVLFDQSVELIERDGKYALEGMLGISAAFVPGQTYKVEIEGESFECVAKELNVFGGTASYIGNAANISNPDTGESFGDDTGEPFTVVTMSMDGAVAMVITIAAPATYVADIPRTFHVKIITMEEKASESNAGIFGVVYTGDSLMFASDWGEFQKLLQSKTFSHGNLMLADATDSGAVVACVKFSMTTVENGEIYLTAWFYGVENAVEFDVANRTVKLREVIN